MAAVEVQCAGCGETLEVGHGTTEFACPDCATAQRLPPELMPPPPPRPRRAIPLPPAGGRAAAVVAHDRLPCGGCGAMLSIPPGLGSFACPICGSAGHRPQAAAGVAALAVAQPLLSEPEVLKDPQSHAGQVHLERSHAGQVHLERYKAPVRTDPSQGWHPNYSSYRDEPVSSLRGDKRVSVHGAAAHGESYNTSGDVHNSERSPVPRTTTGPNKRKSRVQSSFVDYVQANCPIQAIPGLRAQRGSTDNMVDIRHSDQSQGRLPSDVTSSQGKQKTAVAPSIDGKEQIEPSNHQDAHEQQADRASILGFHADQLQVNTRSKTAERKQKKNRSKQSTGGNHKRTSSMTATTKEMLQLRRSNRLVKRPTVPMDTEPTQLLNSSPNQNHSEHQDVTSIIASVTPSSLLHQPVHEARCNELDDVCESTLPSSSNHAMLQAECITNLSVEFNPHEVTRTLPSRVSASQPDVPAGTVYQSSKKCKVSAQSLKRRKGNGPSKLTEPCRESDSHSRSANPTEKLGSTSRPRRKMPVAKTRNQCQHADAESISEEDEDIVPKVQNGWRSRGTSSLPDIPCDEEQKPILTPVGDTMWLVDPSFKNARLPNGIIGCIVRECYPGMVNYRGTNRHAENWKHFEVAPDPLGEKQNVLERISADFWARYRWKDGCEAHAQRVVKNVIKKEVPQLIYAARICAVQEYFKKFRGTKIREEEARSLYLSPEEYMLVMPSWMQNCPDAWESLAQKWSSETWKKRSMESRKRRNMNRQPGHRQGSSSLLRLCQKKGEEEGRDVTLIEGFLYGHRSKDSSNPDSVCNDLALQRLEAYKEAVLEIHGPDYDWINNPVDIEAVRKVCGRKPHGRWPIFDGLVNSMEVLSNAKSQTAENPVTRLQAQGRQTVQAGEVEDRLKQMLEEKLQQMEESQRARDEEMKQQMRQELKEQVAAAVQSTNEYWLSYIQSHIQQNGANIPLPPLPPFLALHGASQSQTDTSSGSASTQRGTPDGRGVRETSSEPGQDSATDGEW